MKVDMPLNKETKPITLIWMVNVEIKYYISLLYPRGVKFVS